MLVELHIENLGVIDRAELVLGEGMTALTGETGAGKTMLVEAIELLVGGRADAAMVRRGAAEARVDGRFVMADGDPVDSDAADEREVVLSRVVPAEGRSRAYVNGRLSTVASLAEIAGPMLDLHGQHAHQSLLAPGTQRAALDRFAGIGLGELRAARAAVIELDAELAALGGDARARAREIDLLRFQVAELDAAGIDDAAEDRRLAVDEEVLADAVAHRSAGAVAVELLTDDDVGRGALAGALAAVADRAPYRSARERLLGVLAELDDVAAEIRSVAEGIEEDPARLDQVRSRRQLLADLCRKYGDDLGEVMAFHRDAAERLADLEGFSERAAELEHRRAEAVDAARRVAAAVAAARRAAAPRLASLVQTRLRDLAMPHAEVQVEVHDDPRDPHDAPGNRVELLLAANPGTPLLPLTRVASGGELARAMLALRLALTVDAPADRPGSALATGSSTGGSDRIGTLVFDEVDAGIGGSAAVAVGDALATLGARHQVLVVTHLPQVAARADRHVTVTKTVTESVTGSGPGPSQGTPATVTRVQVVSGDERVAEVARMLAGADTDVARQHARSLLGDEVPATARSARPTVPRG